MEIPVQDVIRTNSDDVIQFTVGKPCVIQMPYELTERVIDRIDKTKITLLSGKFNGFEKMTIKEHIEFYIKWYNSKSKTTDLLQQFFLEEHHDVRLANTSEALQQRIAMIQVLLSETKYVLAVDPFLNMTNENIRLFHSMMSTLNDLERGLVVIVTKTEDAFLVSEDVYKLNNEGLKRIVMNESESEEPSLRKLKAKAEDKTIFIDVADIEYIESNDGKVFVNVGREKFTLSETLTMLESQLTNQKFYRCHRSYIVNLNKVSEIITWSKNSYSIVIDNLDQTKIPLSRNKFNEIQDLMVR